MEYWWRLCVAIYHLDLNWFHSFINLIILSWFSPFNSIIKSKYLLCMLWCNKLCICLFMVMATKRFWPPASLLHIRMSMGLIRSFSQSKYHLRPGKEQERGGHKSILITCKNTTSDFKAGMKTPISRAIKLEILLGQYK